MSGNVVRALVFLAIAAPLQIAQNPVVLFTADRGGALQPCSDCPGATALGGAARMATLVRGQRVEGPVLLLDAGNAFFGSSDALGEPGLAVRDLYDAVEYDVVNVGFRDFRFGLPATRALLAGAVSTPVSSNLLDADGQLLFDPFALKELGDRTVAIVGVTMRPPGLDYLPHLQRQLAGITVADPLETLAEVLPLAREGADHVVLLLYGERELLEAVCERFGSDVDAIAVGGLRPAELPERGSTLVAASSPGGRHLTRFVLGGEAEVELLEVGPDLPPDAKVQALLADELVTTTYAPVEVSRPLPVDAALTAGEPALVDVWSSEPGFGSGLILRVSSVARSSLWQGLEAPAGKDWMVFQLGVENDVPASLAFGGSRQAGEKLLVVQKQKLFLLCGEDARTVLPSASVGKPENPAAVLPGKFVLDYVGDSRAGQVAFAVHEDAFANGVLQLRLYHDEVPVAAVDVRGTASPDGAELAGENAYVSLARPVVSFPETVRRRAPPAGARWVVATLRGRSRTARPAFYLEAPTHLELLVDGMWARRAESELGSLPPEPTFLPDRYTGGTAVFLAPVESRSLELSCAFPLFTLEDGEELAPELLRFPLAGEPVEPQPEQAAVVIDDGPLPLAVIGVERTQAVGDLTAADGRTLLVLDCRVENRGPGGMFGPRERFLIADARPVATLDLANLPLVEPLLVPAGARRAFRVVLDAPAAIGGPTDLTYSGVTVRPNFTLEVPDEPATDFDTAVAEVEPHGSVKLGAVWREHATPVSEPSWSPRPGVLDTVPPPVTVGGVTLAVTAAAFATELEGRESKEDEVFLALEVGVSLAADVEPLTVSGFVSHLFGVLDRCRTVGLQRANNYLPNSFTLEPGDKVEGKLVFVLPRAGFESFSLELVLPEREGIHVPVLEPARPLPGPFSSLGNQASRVDVLGFLAAKELSDRKPAGGYVFVAVDMRARNQLVGETLPAGLLVWHRMMERIQLVVDGLHPISPRLSMPTDLPSELTLLPTENVGGRLVFEVPQKLLSDARSVELVCGFESVEMPGGGLLYPEPLRHPLVGKRPDLALPDAVHTIEDLDGTVVVGAFDRPEAFLERAPRQDSSWVTADFWFTAPPERGTVVAPVRRFTLLDAEGGVHPIHGATWKGVSPSKRGKPFWIPAGGTRRIRAAFEVPDESVDDLALLHRGLRYVRALALDPEQVVDAPATDLRRATNGQLVFDDAREPRGLEGVGLKPEQVNQAIDRGRDFLWNLLREGMKRDELSGNRYDYPALLALVHCRAHEVYPELDQALRRLLARLKVERLAVYDLGLVAMIVDALDDPEFDRLLEDTLLCLVESQGPGGSWSYGTRLVPRLFPDSEPEPEEPSAGPRLEVVGGEPPDGDGSGLDRITRTQSWYSNKDGDNSVSQFSVLGLASAERNGLAIDVETWRGILGAFGGRQSLGVEEKYGGWGYMASTPYGSMTCSGICSTAIALRRFDPTADPRDDLRIRDGLAWLDRNWTLTENPGSNHYQYYYLYGLERVGRILDLEFIGAHEWYPEGARYLVGAQKPDGSWPGGKKEQDPRLGTSFALLFLTRATESLELDEEVAQLVDGPGILETVIDLPAGEDSVYVILDASGSMLAELGGRRKFDVARDALRGLIAGLPEGTPFALRVYGHRKRAIEEGAAEDTELLVPFAELDREALNATLDKLRPRGKTPLTLSLEEAGRDLGQAPEGRDTLVILLTDGGEDTRKDPVAAAEAWAKRSSVRLFVVGFDIDRPEWTRQLHAIADAAGGEYLQVDEADALAAHVTSILAPEPPAFEVTDEKGTLVVRGRFGVSFTLEPAPYTITFHYSGEPFNTTFWVNPGRTTKVRLDLQARGNR